MQHRDDTSSAHDRMAGGSAPLNEFIDLPRLANLIRAKLWIIATIAEPNFSGRCRLCSPRAKNLRIPGSPAGLTGSAEGHQNRGCLRRKAGLGRLSEYGR